MLHGLAKAGIERAVVVLGVGAEQLVDSVKQENYGSMRVEFIWGIDNNWGTSYANGIMTARSSFPGDEPLLIVRSDYLFDSRLLEKIAGCRFTADTAAYALVDSNPETLEWVSGGAPPLAPRSPVVWLDSGDTRASARHRNLYP